MSKFLAITMFLAACTTYNSEPSAPDAGYVQPTLGDAAVSEAIDTEHCSRTQPIDGICAAREGQATAFTCQDGYVPRPDVVCFYLPGEVEPPTDGVSNLCCCPPDHYPCP